MSHFQSTFDADCSGSVASLDRCYMTMQVTGKFHAMNLRCRYRHNSRYRAGFEQHIERGCEADCRKKTDGARNWVWVHAKRCGDRD